MLHLNVKFECYKILNAQPYLFGWNISFYPHSWQVTDVKWYQVDHQKLVRGKWIQLEHRCSMYPQWGRDTLAGWPLKLVMGWQQIQPFADSLGLSSHSCVWSITCSWFLINFVLGLESHSQFWFVICKLAADDICYLRFWWLLVVSQLCDSQLWFVTSSC
jgi:hypothetical protein